MVDRKLRITAERACASSSKSIGMISPKGFIMPENLKKIFQAVFELSSKVQWQKKKRKKKRKKKKTHETIKAFLPKCLNKSTMQ